MTDEETETQVGCDQPKVIQLEMGFEDLVTSGTHTFHPWLTAPAPSMGHAAEGPTRHSLAWFGLPRP